MSLDPRISFASGELDPALHERTNLQKYRSSLKTARGVVVGKSGRLVSAMGRKHFGSTKSGIYPVKLHAMSHNGCYLEFGKVYGLYHDQITGGTFTNWFFYVRQFKIADRSMVWEAYIDDPALSYYDLDNIHFTDIDVSTVAVCLYGREALVVDLKNETFGPYDFTSRYAGTQPAYKALSTSGTGYDLEYAFTMVKDGQEGIYQTHIGGKLPLTGTELVTLTIKVAATSDTTKNQISEVRVYRRPDGAGAFGYIGSTTEFRDATGDWVCDFADYGQNADYAHSPPVLNDDIEIAAPGDGGATVADTSVMYQQRFMIAQQDVIVASRTSYPRNFVRDFPLNPDCSLSFKSSGVAVNRVLRMIDHEGLVVFTTNGAYLHSGVLSPTNMFLEHHGYWIIDQRVPPIPIPGGVLFVDSLTNVVRQLTWSQENQNYIAEELSIFSDHLFAQNRIVSWAFQDGTFPLLWVVFADGTWASFTYEREHEMRAWTRHDCGDSAEYVVSTKKMQVADILHPGVSSIQEGAVLFVMNRNGTRYIEQVLPRYPTVETIQSDSEYDKGESIAKMVGVVSYNNLLNSRLVGSDVFSYDPNTGVLSCGTSGVFSSAAVGDIYRWFNPGDQTSCDFIVQSVTNSSNLVVQTSIATFPSDKTSGLRLYSTQKTFTGLSHLEGKDVAIIVDGYVVASPFNDIDGYPTVTVVAGQIDLPGNERGAIVHIGLPFYSDVETLDVDTVEQRPVLIESKTANKVYVRTMKSKGLYVGNTFPSSGVAGMIPLDRWLPDYTQDNPIIGNKPKAPESLRHEGTIPGDWNSQGRICLRSVDPLHFEILSIITDLEDLRR